MKKLLLLLGALPLCASTLLAQVEPDSAALRARRAAQETFTDLNGEGWTIRTDTASAVPVSIFVSAPIEQVQGLLSAVRPQGKTPAEKAVRFFTAHKEMFGLQPAQDEMVVEQTRQSEGRSYVRVNQVYQGVPVYRGSYTVTLGRDGSLEMVSGEFFPGIDVQTTPSLSPQDASKQAISASGSETLRSEPEVDLVIYPDEERYALAYKVKVLEEDLARDWLVFVDATSGEVLDIRNVSVHLASFHALPGLDATSKAAKSATSESALRAMVTTGSGKAYADDPGVAGPITVSLPRLNGSGYRLEGTYVDVDNEDTAPNDAYSSTATFNYAPSDTRFDEVNLYYHVDMYAAYLPSINFAGLGRTIEATAHWGVNLPDAIYDLNGTRDLFFGDGDGVVFGNYAKEDEVIYHEFNHAVLHHLGTLYDQTEARALHEGTADYLAASYTNNSRIGQWVTLCTSTGDLRRVDNSKSTFRYSNLNNLQYAACSSWPGGYLNPQGSAHANGMIWSGSLWDLRTQIGKTKTDKLVIKAFFALGPHPTFLQARDAMINADNNTNAGANVCAIRKAFADRGIGTVCPTPPAAPTNLVITNDGASGQSPQLTWNASSGATSYNVYRCLDNPLISTDCNGPSAFTKIGSSGGATSYTDNGVQMRSSCSSGGTYYKGARYFVKAVNAAGESGASNEDATCSNQAANKQGVALAAQEGALEAVPTEYALEAAYPNPFNPTTEIRFALPEAADVRLVVYDALGREVARLVDGPVGAGYRHATFDASGLPSGMYLYRLEAKGAAEVFAKTGRMVLVK